MTTSDGYILALHRIPNRMIPNRIPNRRRTPVLLGHCLVGSSAIWTFGPTDQSLAYQLADAGETLWLPEQSFESHTSHRVLA